MKDKSLGCENLVIYGGTYLNKGGAAIAYGTLKVFKKLDINFKYIIDPDPFFPEDFFRSFNLTPIYRYSNTLCTKELSSVNPIRTFHPFIKCLIKSYDPQVRQLRGAPIWHIGDSPFSDRHSTLSLIGQVVALQSLKMSIKGKTIIGGVSLEYPRTKIGEMFLRHLFKKVDYFFIRGKETYSNLRKLGVSQDKMSIICDFAFHLDREKTKRSKAHSKLIRESSKPTIALVLRDYAYSQYRDSYIRTVRQLIYRLERNYDIFFIPTAYSFFIPENDLVFLERELRIDANRIINIRDYTPEEIISIFSDFDIVISTRLHGAIYGALARVPTVHIYDARKSLEVVGSVFGETIPLINFSEFVKENSLNKITRIIVDLIQKKDEISYEISLHIKNAKEKSINELKSAFEKKSLLE